MDARKTDRATIALLVLMYAVLAANVAVYVVAPLPAALHVVVSAAAIHLAFTIWHEAVHLNVSRRTWVNNWVGVLGMFPYMTPYFMQRWIHLRHHARLNEPDDPNVIYTDGPFRTIVFRYPRALRYARQIMRDDPRRGGEKLADTIFGLAVATIYFAAWWNGHLVDALILWFVPVVAAKLVMDWYINYIPHAGLPAHRFKGTRVLDVAWLTPLVLEHNYHAVHHLWPNIPWHRYRGVFREKRDYLQENGVPIEYRVFGAGARTRTVAQQGAVSR